MRRSIYRTAILLVILFSGATSCTERIEIDALTQDPQLVIFGYISNVPDRYCIELSRTQPFFGKLDMNQTHVSGAEVTINGVLLEEEDQSPGKYYTKETFRGRPGMSYNLRVKVDFDKDGEPEVYESHTTMPEETPLDSVVPVVNKIAMYPNTNVLISFNYYFTPKVGSYAGASFSIYGIPFVDRITRHILSPFGRIVDNHYISGYPFFMMRPDFFTTQSMDTVLFYPGARYEVGLRTYSSELYEFVRVASVESSPGNPLFSGPPANVPGNISNGALGCFGAYSEVTERGLLPWKEEYIQGLWYDRTTGMVIEFAGNQATVVVKGSQNRYNKGDVLLKDIKIQEDNFFVACKIKESDGYQPEKMSFTNYFQFQFSRNGGKWVRV